LKRIDSSAKESTPRSPKKIAKRVDSGVTNPKTRATTT
jgi:hypothetical protein